MSTSCIGDNLDVPVGEFVDAMDREVKAGRIRGPFGGSNGSRNAWTRRSHMLTGPASSGPAVLSNNFSLAEMLVPIWPGCVTSSTDA